MKLSDKKILFTFSLKETIGEDIKTRYFAIVKPTGRISELGQIFYAKIYSSLLEDGIMPAKLVEKRFVQDGGVLSSKEIEIRENLYNDLYKIIEEVKGIEEKTGDITDDEKKKIEELKKKQSEIVFAIAEIEKNNQNLFENTAEVLANQKTILFYALNLAFEKINDDYVPFFGEGDFDKRKEKMYSIEEDGSEFETKVLATFLGITSLYFTNKSITQDDVDEVVKKIE